MRVPLSCGEVADGWYPSDHREYEEEWDELEAGIMKCVKEYLDKTDNTPNFFRLENVHMVNL